MLTDLISKKEIDQLIGIIIREFKQKKEKIFTDLRESVRVYNDLVSESKTPIINNIHFQRKYFYFYAMSHITIKNKDGKTRPELFDKFLNKYFELIDKKETRLPFIINELEQISGKTWFSYATKLINMIDNTQPIFDSMINKLIIKVVKDAKTEKSEIKKLLNKQSKNYEQIYSSLKGIYELLLKDKQIRALVDKIKNEFKYNISYEKYLDFLLWWIGKELTPKKKNKNIT
ncbi:MAG: hypothetical protein WC307_03090 [Candidatus Nanoarchaeia archaeon]|jgi:hypothetical protein